MGCPKYEKKEVIKLLLQRIEEKIAEGDRTAGCTETAHEVCNHIF